MDGNGPVKWKTGQNHILGTNTHTWTRERIHVQNLADTRRGREWTRAMENWANPCTRHTNTRTRNRERAERIHVKKLADARRGREWTRAMENW